MYCRNCARWKNGTPDWGCCEKMEESLDLANSSYVAVQGDFGCIHFEERARPFSLTQYEGATHIVADFSTGELPMERDWKVITAYPMKQHLVDWLNDHWNRKD